MSDLFDGMMPEEVVHFVEHAGDPIFPIETPLLDALVKEPSRAIQHEWPDAIFPDIENDRL